MFIGKVCIVLTLGAITFSKPTSTPTVIHERRNNIPKGFTVTGPADNSSNLTLRIVLTSDNLAGLEEEVYKTTYRGNGIFRDHLTKEEVESFVSPAAETTFKVTEWLSSNSVNFTTISPAGNWLRINVDVPTANRLLETNFMSFREESTGKEVVRTLSYSIPAELQPHIQLIHPTTEFPLKVKSPLIKFTPKSRGSKVEVASRATPSACNVDEVTPTCLADFYGIPLTIPAQNTSKIAVAEFIDQFAQQADLTAFLKSFRPDLSSGLSFVLQTIDGGTNPQSARDAGILADLNVEYTVGLAPNVPVTVISVGEDNTDDIDGFMDLTNFLLSESSPPQVLLVAFGFDEPDVPASVAQPLCNNYMQLSARGVSVIVSAGDGGVSGSQAQSCTTFIPTFPSTCPFVTSVGATDEFSPEVAATNSAGGFSNIFAAPTYQKTAISKYLSQIGTTNAGKFNESGRAFPDVSAQQGVVVVVGGEEGEVEGTSISATVFASVVGLINAELLSSGFPTLGLLNPFIYSGSGGFNDITTGDNPGCDTNGFPALVGWDPVTGVGTPNFAMLSALEPGF